MTHSLGKLGTGYQDVPRFKDARSRIDANSRTAQVALMRIATRLAAAFAVYALACGWAQAGSITVYTALENDEVSVYLAAARQAMPDLHVHVLRLSTGDLAARLIAESAAPHNDVIWGEALTDMLDPRIEAELAPVTSPNIAKLPSRYRAPDDKWFVATGYLAAFCVNTDALAAQHLPMPTSWADLAKPVYKGQVVMPDPQSSGTGYMIVAAILQGMGADKGWALLKQIAGNVAQFSPSGSSPCKLARTGEFPIGVSFAFTAMQSIRQGFPIRMVIPSSDVAYQLEASAMMKTSANQVDAKRFLDWIASPQAAALYRKYKSIVAMPGAGPTPEQIKDGLPADIAHRLYPMDFKASMENRAATIARWKSDVAN
ncbi:iron(III) transport system substrate-binding protein [Rhodanobacter glycinis]|jgi:iron(III) transport system substrate-binding protein|uniref:Iron(III) transport system substrate-binding protein n=3 Tax=Gammaproteobacteria TaxID=1236 RepID=A0A1I3Z6J2_9GAMM|nr:iron(III) transport system substrate-binding protein [Rhodanobacter glycinis]